MNKIAIILLLVAMTSVAACSNTLEGMGKDIQAMGKSIEEAGNKE